VSSLTSLQRVLPEVMLALFLIDLLFVEVNHLCSVIMLGKQVASSVMLCKPVVPTCTHYCIVLFCAKLPMCPVLLAYLRMWRTGTVAQPAEETPIQKRTDGCRPAVLPLLGSTNLHWLAMAHATIIVIHAHTTLLFGWPFGHVRKIRTTVCTI